MSAATDIANYLDTQGHGTAGTNIFAHQTPDSPHTCISVYSFGSPMPSKSHGKGSSNAVWAIIENLQVQYRSKSRSTGAAQMRAIWETLEAAGGFTVSGNEYLYIETTRYPGQLRVDDNDRTIFFGEFRVTYRSGL